MSHRIAKLACVALLALSSGCATIPSSGPVVTRSRIAEQGQAGVMIQPVAPPKGANPSQIVTGFLTAMASFDAGYATARQYLTDQAAADWNPGSEVLIYTDATTPQANGDQVSMSGRLVGYLRSDGSFSGAEDSSWSHDFGIVEEDGEPRISHPPRGLALSQYMFSQIFIQVDTYFFPPTSTTLVPDPRYVQRGAWDRTAAARLVLAGPSDWLGRIVDNQWRSGLTLAGDVALTSQGVAQVPLSEEARLLTSGQATLLAIEIAATMRGLPGISQVRLECAGESLRMEGLPFGDAMPLAIVEGYDTQPRGMAESLAVAQDGVISLTGQTSATPVPPDWASAASQIDSFALRREDGAIAAVTDQGLLVGGADEAPTNYLERTDLLRPQFDAQGGLWAVAPGDPPTVALVTRDGLVDVDVTALRGVDIRRFQVSPDGHRMLVVRQADSPAEGNRQEVGVALIVSTATGVALTSYKPIRLTWEGADIKSIVDVAWTGPSSVLVLGSSGAGMPSVFSTDLDGLDTADWGRQRTWSPVEMAVHITSDGVQVAVLDSSGAVYAYQDDQWPRLGNDADPVTATAIAYPV